jgi:hypothetical protein
MKDTTLRTNKSTALSGTGRPSSFTRERGFEICERLADGETLTEILLDKGMPAGSTVRRWRSENSAFRSAYAQAREDQMQAWSDEIIFISDDSTLDYMTKVGRNGREYEAPDHEHIARSRLRVDTRKFLMSKIAPRLYGDKITHEHQGEVTHKHELSSRERMRRMALFMLEDQAAGNGAGQVIDGEVSNLDSGSAPGTVDKDTSSPPAGQ